MSKINVMVDLETLGTMVNAPILSIGACVFNMEGPVQGKQAFYVECSLESQLDHRPIDLTTLRWWNKQGNAPYDGETALNVALANFNQWLVMVSDGKVDDLIVWCKGLDFDIAILNLAIRQQNINVMWKYNAVRDMRTVLKVLKSNSSIEKLEALKNNPQPHNALEDAKHQAYELVGWMGRFGIGLE